MLLEIAKLKKLFVNLIIHNKKNSVQMSNTSAFLGCFLLNLLFLGPNFHKTRGRYLNTLLPLYHFYVCALRGQSANVVCLRHQSSRLCNCVQRLNSFLLRPQMPWGWDLCFAFSSKHVYLLCGLRLSLPLHSTLSLFRITNVVII